MGDSRYKDNLTTLAKRLRPLLLSIAEGAMNANEWDNIILIVADGGGTSYYDPDATGFAAAIAAASSGDVIYVPPATISGNHTVPSGVAVYGESKNTIFSGTITNNGLCYGFLVTGNVINTGILNRVFVEHTTGAGITQSAAATIFNCEVTTGASATYGIDISGGYLSSTYVGFIGGANIGVYCHGADVEISHCRFGGGAAGGLVNQGQFIDNCLFGGRDNGDGLQHTTSGTAVLSNCKFRWTGTGSGVGADIDDTGLTLIDCAWDTIDGIANITYGTGDRGSYSVEDYHAADIEGAALLRHLPSPVGEDDNDIAYVDTNVWVIGSAADAGISGDDEKVGVSANDSTPGYLNGKLVAGTNITLTEGSDGGDETLTIDAAAAAADPTDAYWEPAVDAD